MNKFDLPIYKKLFESIITNLGKDKKPQKAKLAREISQTIKPSNIDEYIKVRTATPTPTRPIEITQREDLIYVKD
jgi:hypothetical protein